MERPADQRLDPTQGPALATGEPVRQRAPAQLGLQPGPLLLRAQLLLRPRPPGVQRRISAVLPGPPSPPHRPRRDPQVPCDLIDPDSPGEPPGGLQSQPLQPSGHIPATLRILHIPVIRRQPAAVRAAVILRQWYPEVRVETFAGKVATDALRYSVRHADVMVIADRAAAHAATDAIKASRGPSVRLVRTRQGYGVTGPGGSRGIRRHLWRDPRRGDRPTNREQAPACQGTRSMLQDK